MDDRLDELRHVDRTVCGDPDTVDRVLHGVIEDVVTMSVIRPECHRLRGCRRLRDGRSERERLVVAEKARPVQGTQQMGCHEQDQSDEQDGRRGTTLDATADHHMNHTRNAVDRLRRITIRRGALASPAPRIQSL
ncbi:hypothetical protein [Streptomyces sp. NBC_00005]|uniref:hypothetical protein n=1 Tax=Streptomyces sp. NBC_00005 TaxID=2903609 RepID=UPI0032433208